MSIQGSLKTMPVPELLMWISSCQKTGTLEVASGDHLEQIAFDVGFLIYSASTELEKTFGHILIARGMLSEAQHTQARRIREDQRIALAKVLKDLHILPEDEIVRMLRKKAEAEIFELFKSVKGEFRFLDDELPDLDLLPLRVDVARALLRITQQMDESGNYDYDQSGIRFDIPPG
ncbi:MAG: DUF4388 domain-containing protein [Acidobacteria bacterium]|nr:DUF4388 domain-containing protein [Acidobacteriota bacterium]